MTKDALPFARTIGSRPARIFGVNTIGLQRRGFTPNTVTQLRQAYRYLLQSKLNTTRALAQIEQDSALTAPEVRYMVDFIRASQRGVILRRAGRRAEELVASKVQSAQLVRSSGFERLDNAAKDAFMQCKFTPGTIDGVAQASWVKQPFTWRLK